VSFPIKFQIKSGRKVALTVTGVGGGGWGAGGW